MSSHIYTPQVLECIQWQGDCRYCSLPKLGLESAHTKFKFCNIWQLLQSGKLERNEQEYITEKSRIRKPRFAISSIVNYLNENPGATLKQMAAHWKISSRTASNYMTHLTNQNLVRVEYQKARNLFINHYYLLQ